MIEQDDIFAEIKNNLALWCDTDCKGADLAAAAGNAIANKLRAISVEQTEIGQLWAWLENKNIEIFGRFWINTKIDDALMSDLATRISTSFCDGADGAIIFMRLRDLARFVSEMSCVRDDLFFNKTLSIGLDINEIESSDWENVFRMLRDVRADAITLFLSNDDGNKSDFVGRIYALLTSEIGDWHGAIYFVSNENISRIDQVFRLTQQIRPDLASSMLFWVKNE